MATLNNLYVFVETEDVSYGAEISSHPVEKGIEVSDHIKQGPCELSISGKIVKAGSRKASNILSRLRKYQREGTLIDYSGRNIISNLQISDFSTGHPNNVWGGCTFSMTLKEVRIAKPAYVAQKKTETGVKDAGTQQVEKGSDDAVFYKVKNGDTVWSLVYEGGYDKYNPKITKQRKLNMIIEANPHAFSRPGDPTTLQIGRVLLMGYRNSHEHEWLDYQEAIRGK